MRAARFIQEPAYARKLFDDRLILGHLAVEYAEWVAAGAALAIRAHLAHDRFKRLAESLVKLRAIVRTANRIQF